MKGKVILWTHLNQAIGKRILSIPAPASLKGEQGIIYLGGQDP